MYVLFEYNCMGKNGEALITHFRAISYDIESIINYIANYDIEPATSFYDIRRSLLYKEDYITRKKPIILNLPLKEEDRINYIGNNNQVVECKFKDYIVIFIGNKEDFLSYKITYRNGDKLILSNYLQCYIIEEIEPICYDNAGLK